MSLEDKNRDFKSKIVDYLTGNFSKRELTRIILPIFLITVCTSLFLAILLYPPESNYNIFTNSISSLGSKEGNPFPGWLIFSLGIYFLGFQAYPIILYFHKRLNKICLHTTRTGTLFGLVGCVFVFLIGVFSDDNVPLIGSITLSDIHVVIAVIGIGGWAFLVVFYSFPLNKDNRIKDGGKQQFPRIWVNIAYAFLIIGGLGMGISEIIKEILDFGFPGPGFLSFTFWEWIFIMIFVLFLTIMSFATPETVESLDS